MDISIIIVNYNTADLVCKAIDSCLTQQGISSEIIVVDNASHDDSVEKLKAYGDKIHLVANSENLGFGQANNQGFTHSHGDYIFLLNPDAEFSTDHDLADMLLFMHRNPKIGLAGTRIVDSNGKETFPRYNYPGDKRCHTLFADLPGLITWVLGAAMIIPRAIWEQTGGFDKAYFLYGDEVDWCLRIRKLGFVIGHNSKVIVLHQGSASEKSATSFAKWTRKQQGLQVFIQRYYPEAIARKIIRRDYWRSIIRMRFLQLRSLFGGWNEAKQARFERYRAIAQSAKAFLK